MGTIIYITALSEKNNIEKTGIRSSEYIEIIKRIANKGNIKELFANTPLTNPFLISIMYADGTEQEIEMQKAFSSIIALRHLRFPSPIIDWTTNFNVAAGFAIFDRSNSNCIIHCLREKRNQHWRQTVSV